MDNIYFVLHLTFAEAHQLKLTVQNPICDEEPEAAATMRKKVFEALPSIVTLERLTNLPP